jgi:hypothetical protein
VVRFYFGVALRSEYLPSKDVAIVMNVCSKIVALQMSGKRGPPDGERSDRECGWFALTF